MNSPITDEIAVAYCTCKLKAYLLLRGEHGEYSHPYVLLKEGRASAGLKIFLNSSKQAGLRIQHCKGGDPTAKADVFAQVTLRSNRLQASADALFSLKEPDGKGQSPVEPHLAIGTDSIAKEDKIRLAFIGLVLGNDRRHRSHTGVIINALGDTQRIKLVALMGQLEPAIETLKAWKDSPDSTPPPIILNDHCPICRFRRKCLEQAEKDDSLTLLDRMTEKVMRKYHKKGIFTITQLSYLFKPRRPRKKSPVSPLGFNLELQALALRTGKTYIHQSPIIPQHPTEIYLDIEGVPDHGSNYLIGLVIRFEGRAESYSLWADSIQNEGRILEEFLEIANRHSDAPIYHYGSYEPKALMRMATASRLDVEAIIRRLVNVNTSIFGKVYFPTRSNTLKELGRHLGATWSSPDACGLQSVVWRMQWQDSGDVKLKKQLLEYNLEDCNALALLVSELRKIGQSSIARFDVAFADTPKRNATPSSLQIHDSLEGILQSANEKYKKNRIKLRPNEIAKETKNPLARKGHPCFQRISPPKAGKVVRVKRPIKCPRWKAHSSTKLEPSDKTVEHVVIDLAFTKNGCRKTITKFVGFKGFCTLCQRYYSPPSIRRLGNRVFGHSFRAWAVYQRITLRLPYRVIAQVFYDLFHEQISVNSTVNFLSDLAEYYGSTERASLKRILTSPFIHVDETKLNIQGSNYYVWVLTDGLHVVFRLTETREPKLIQEILKDYSGILISDFYGGYDACSCRQQKCLVHLIRDLNDDLWKNPFNSELEDFVSAVRDLIVPIMADVEKFGLKKRHLRKHQQTVDRFFSKVIERQEHKCEIIQTYQKRFLRYRECLFRF